MSLPTSLRAYEDCRNLYERAATDPKGARACLGTYEASVQMRTRMHYFRKLDRQANEGVYPVGHPMHGQTLYDEYVVQLKEDSAGEWWMYVTPRSSKILAVEGLSEAEADDDLQSAEAPANDPA